MKKKYLISQITTRNKIQNKSLIRTMHVGKKILILNGKMEFELLVTEEMVGFFFGEFVLTKKLGPAIHKQNK